MCFCQRKRLKVWCRGTTRRDGAFVGCGGGGCSISQRACAGRGAFDLNGSKHGADGLVPPLHGIGLAVGSWLYVALPRHPLAIGGMLTLLSCTARLAVLAEVCRLLPRVPGCLYYRRCQRRKRVLAEGWTTWLYCWRVRTRVFVRVFRRLTVPKVLFLG